MRVFGFSRFLNPSSFAAALLLAVILGTLPGGAQGTSELESIREERRQAQEASAEKAAAVDGATAEIAEITAALETLQLNVSSQEVALAAAERELADAESVLAAAEVAVADMEDEIVELREQLVARAVNSFVNQGEVPNAFVSANNPLEAARMQLLVEDVAQGEVDVTNQLRLVSEDLAVERAIATDARAQADQLRVQMADQLEALEAARDEQAALLEVSAGRLDRLLGELAILQAHDAELSQRESAAVAALAAQLSVNRPTTSSSRIPIPPESEIVWVRGYAVHQSIAANVELMIDHAARDGIELAGWGWRNPATQIRLRQEHCGTSDYAVYEMPSYQCNPPTATPGASMHERGLALDITYEGRAIGHHYNAAYIWLADHAAAYGFYNLPSEPWHWSTNGS